MKVATVELACFERIMRMCPDSATSGNAPLLNHARSRILYAAESLAANCEKTATDRQDDSCASFCSGLIILCTRLSQRGRSTDLNKALEWAVMRLNGYADLSACATARAALACALGSESAAAVSIGRSLEQIATRKVMEGPFVATMASQNLGMGNGLGAIIAALRGRTPAPMLFRIEEIVAGNLGANLTDVSLASGVSGLLCALCGTTDGFVALETKRLLRNVLTNAIEQYGAPSDWRNLSLAHGAAGLVCAGLFTSLNLGDEQLAIQTQAMLQTINVVSGKLAITESERETALLVALAMMALGRSLHDKRAESAGGDLLIRLIDAPSPKPLRSPWTALTELTALGVIDSEWIAPVLGIPNGTEQVTKSSACLLRSPKRTLQSPPITIGLLDLGFRNGPQHDPMCQAFLDYVVLAEKLGFAHLWIGEHWSADALWSSPLPMIAVLLARTKRMRIGSAGVLLRFHNILRLANEFNLLEHLFPGRVDIGLVPSAPAAPAVKSALSDPDRFSDQFGERLDALVDLMNIAGAHRPAGMWFSPWPPRLPNIWLMGTGVRNLAMAAGRGLNFAHSLAHAIDACHDVERLYKDLTVDASAKRGRVNLVVAGSCAQTTAEASETAGESPILYAYPTVVGTPAQCRERFYELRSATNIADFTFLELALDPEKRKTSLTLLADVLA